MRVSVVVPAYNSEKTIGKCIESLLAQNFPKKDYEIIVVDDGSKDDTIKIIKKFEHVKLLKQSHDGPAKARNFGVNKSKGKIILFTDSDCMADKSWIKNMIEPFNDKDVAGVQGTYKTYNKDKPIARFAGYEIEDRHERLSREIDFMATFSAGFLKSVFLKAGGFDKTYKRASAEDTDLSFKISEMGLKMIFQKEAFVYTYHPESMRIFLKKKFWMGYWRVLLYKKHSKKLMRHSYTPKSVYAGIVLSWIGFIFLLSSVLGVIPLKFSVYSILVHIILNLSFHYRTLRKDFVVGISSPFIMILRDFFTGLGIIYGIKITFSDKR